MDQSTKLMVNKLGSKIEKYRKSGVPVPDDLREQYNKLRRSKKEPNPYNVIDYKITKYRKLGLPVTDEMIEERRRLSVFRTYTETRRTENQKQKSKEYYRNNRESFLKKMKSYRKKNKESLKQKRIQYLKEHLKILRDESSRKKLEKDILSIIENTNQGNVMNPDEISQLRQIKNLIDALIHQHDHPQNNPDEDPFAVSTTAETDKIEKKDWTRPGLWPMVKQDPLYKELTTALLRNFIKEEDWLLYASLFNYWGPKNVIQAVKKVKDNGGNPWAAEVEKVLKAALASKREREQAEAVIKRMNGD